MRQLSFLSLVLFAAACKGEPTDSVVVEPNQAPSANAGVDTTVAGDSAVTVDGSLSADPDGDPLNYHWTFDHVPAGSKLAENSGAFVGNHTNDGIRSSFLADAVGVYVIKLEVDDGKVLSAADYVTITVNASENAPVADAGSDKAGEATKELCFDGSKSYDPLGKPLTYAWTLVDAPEGSTAALTGADTATPCLTPDERGVYVANLIVSNGMVNSAADSVVATVTGDDSAPTASAGVDITGEDCSKIKLDGSGSLDPEGDALQYFWEVQVKPTNSTVKSDTAFEDRKAAKTTFWADQAGTYKISLTVFDGANWSLPDTITLTLSERSYNQAPSVTVGTISTVAAGSACCEEDGYTYDCEECGGQTVTIGDTIVVKDADGDPTTVSWAAVDGDSTFAGSTTDLVTTVKLDSIAASEPAVCDANEFTFTLTVTDCPGTTTTVPVTVNAECCGLDAATDAACTGT